VADYCVGLLRQAVAAAGLADRTTFVIVADHGFVTSCYEANVAPAMVEPALEGRVKWTTEKWHLFGEFVCWQRWSAAIRRRSCGATPRARSPRRPWRDQLTPRAPSRRADC